MWIQIEKNSELPVYRQIMEQITKKIQKKELMPDDQLPTERELSISTGISRGTIKRAYDELSAAGIIQRLQGSGTFVANIENTARLSRKDLALELIDEMLDENDQDEIIEYFKSCETSSLQVAQEELSDYNFNWEQLKIMRIKFLSEYGM